MLKRGLMLTMIVFSLCLMPVRAQNAAWTVWLYERITGRVTQVSSSGAVLSQFTLPAQANSTYSQKAAISADGHYIAYTTAFVPANSTNLSDGSVSLNIYDLTTNALLKAYLLPGDSYSSLDFDAGPLNYGGGNQSFAVGYAQSGVGWKILVFNLAGSNVIELTPNTPAAQAAGVEPGFGMLVPVVRRNRDQQVFFTMVPAATEGAPQYRSYNWNVAQNTVTPNDVYVSLDTDTFPFNNDVIMSLSDSRFPYSVDGELGFALNNTLHYYDTPTLTHYPFLAGINLYLPRFIQNGERIAVSTYSGSSNRYAWQIVERSGTISGTLDALIASGSISGAAGLTNGFAYTIGGSENVSSTLYYVETRSAIAPYKAVPVWSGLPGTDAALIWVSDNSPTNAGPFTPWGQLQLTVPTPAPTVMSSLLTVGGQAVVQTTEGDPLNIRSGPGKSFAIMARLSNGTPVTILEGPRGAEGFIWWRIRANGMTVEGWVVQEADGVQTLLPQ
jgi:hypothetical protein